MVLAGITCSAAAVITARITVWFVIWGCACLFLLEALFMLTPFWSEEPTLNDKLNIKSARARLVQNAPYEEMLQYSFYTYQVLFWWATLLVAALASIWLRHWPFNTQHSHDVALRAKMAELGHKVTRALKYQLPPHRVWAWFLDGGLSAADLLVVLTWLGIVTSCVYCEYKAMMKYSWEDFEASGEWTSWGSLYATRLDAFGLAAGFALTLTVLLVYIPVPRNSFLEYLFGANFSQLIKYHRWLGHFALWMLLLHALPYYTQFIHRGVFWKETFYWQSDGINYLAGSLALVSGCILWVTTIPYIRRHYFNVFLWSHIIGFLGFTMFGLMHWSGFVWFLPGMVFYLLDVTFRMSQWGVFSILRCEYIAEDDDFVTISLTFHKDAKVRASQFLFLNVPSVARLAWHPVSIAAVFPSDDGLTTTAILHLKAYGHWTTAYGHFTTVHCLLSFISPNANLYLRLPDICMALIKELHLNNSLKVRADGPYGQSNPTPSWTAANVLVLIAGGIGVTPMLGILREIVKQRLHKAQDKLQSIQLPSKIFFIWTVRNAVELDMLDRDLLDAASGQNSAVKLQLFVTGATKPASLTQPGQDPSPEASFNHSTASSHSHLQPYGFSDSHWALAHVLSMVGAYFACLMIQAYSLEGYVTSESGFPYWSVGLLKFFAFCAGSMGMPALIIYPLQKLRYKKHVQACMQAHAAQLKTGPSLGNDSLAIQDKAFLGDSRGSHLITSTQSMTGALQLSELSNKIRALECGNRGLTEYSLERPDLHQLLMSVLKDSVSEGNITVIASGPQSLVTASQAACHSAAKAAAEGTSAPMPYICFEAHSFIF